MLGIDQAYLLCILYLIPFGFIGVLVTLVLLKICKVQITKTIVYILSICVLIALFIVVLMTKQVDDYMELKKNDVELQERLLDASQEDLVDSIEYEGPSEEELRAIVEEANRIKR